MLSKGLYCVYKVNKGGGKYETPSDYGICDSSNCSKCGNSFNPFSARVVRIETIIGIATSFNSNFLNSCFLSAM